MPQCVKCKKFLHPDYCVEAAPDDPNDNAKFCLFCKMNTNILTIEDSEGNEVIKVDKEKAVRMYELYIKDLKESRKIDHLIKTGKQSRIIMPGDK